MYQSSASVVVVFWLLHVVLVPFSLCSPQSVSVASRKLSFLMASVGLLHKSDGVSVVE